MAGPVVGRLRPVIELRWVLFIFKLVMIITCKADQGVPCQDPGSKMSPQQRFCQCKTGGGTYDFSNLERQDDNPYVAKVPDQSGSSLTEYYFNPCTTVPMPRVSGTNTCNFAVENFQAAVCQKSHKTYFNLGTLNSARGFKQVDGIVFTITGGKDQRQSTIKMLCDQSVQHGQEKLEFLMEAPEKNYTLEMRTKAACNFTEPKPSPHISVGGAISVGTILIICFGLSMISYFSFGIFYNIRFRQQLGSERIPNVIFWMALPSLIMDGARFVRSGFRTTSTYEQL